jgi:septal ring factor EnvC (AmiA/AmiB activator)
LVTVFAHKGQWKFGYGQGLDRIYSDPYPTQEAAKLTVADAFKVPSAPRADEEESTTVQETAAAQTAPQYATKNQFDKLAAYVNQLVAEHNNLEQRVIGLEAQAKELKDILLGNGVEPVTR